MEVGMTVTRGVEIPSNINFKFLNFLKCIKKKMLSLVVLAHVSIYLGYDLTSNDTKFTLSTKIINYEHYLFIVFSISQQQLLANFENVKSEIKNRLLTQLLIIGAVIIVILIISLQ